MRAYSEMLHILQSRESVQRINEMSFASGNMDRSQASSFIHELNRDAAGRKAPKPHRPQSIEELQRLAGGLTEIVP